jgi:hypothetical protein
MFVVVDTRDFEPDRGWWTGHNVHICTDEAQLAGVISPILACYFAAKTEHPWLRKDLTHQALKRIGVTIVETENWQVVATLITLAKEHRRS